MATEEVSIYPGKKARFEATIRRLTAEIAKVVLAKNMAYAGDDDPFKNFNHCAALGICSAEQGILVRLSDKLTRAATLSAAQQEGAGDESLRDTCLDGAGYFLILAAMLEMRG